MNNQLEPNPLQLYDSWIESIKQSSNPEDWKEEVISIIIELKEISSEREIMEAPNQ